MDHALLMDRIYGVQRYFYDYTRKFCLLGRDSLLRMMNPRPDEQILEIGCGTGRNLAELSRLFPGVRLFGLDVSEVMLDYARRKNLSDLPDVSLARGEAEKLSYDKTFGLDRPFDHVFFSYSLSMIPDWETALQAAVSSLAPGGSLYIVDFGGQHGWPDWVRGLLIRWLALFHVRPEPGIPARLESWSESGFGRLETINILGGYAFIACLSGIGGTDIV